MTSLSYFPVVEDEGQLVDLLSRAAWFLSFCTLDRIYIPVGSAHLLQIEWRVATGMDEVISEKFAKLRDKVVFIVAQTEGELHECMTEANIILRWRKDSVPRFVSPKALAAWEKGKKILQVDPVAIRQEGSYYIEVGLHLLANKQQLINENKAKFEKLATRLGQFDQAYLMATGPSVENYRKFDFNNAISIVCNSVILDEELMRRVRPQILVFADPIFHFGPSQYSGSFRKSLIESAKQHDFTICMPFKYYALFVAAVPELANRTVGIPFTKDRDWNFSLTNDFNLKTTANILTFLMIPLACTFAKKIGIIGCDGRPLEQNTYFWGHNEKTQINDKMANIREVHPGFFAIDYNNYYLEHCQTLEAQLKAGESENKLFLSLGFSHIPALNSRYGRGHRIVSNASMETPLSTVIIDPDVVDWSGHFMAYNDKLTTAFTNRGCSVKVLCNSDVSQDILKTREHFRPALTVKSWQVGQADSDYHPRRFRDEVLTALADLFLDGGTLLLYMYAGSVEHAKALSVATQRYRHVIVNINLFWLQNRNFGDLVWVEKWRNFFLWLDAAEPRFRVTVPTRELQAEVATVFGTILDVALHPCTGAAAVQALPNSCTQNSFGIAQILFPGSARPEKGIDVAFACARLLGSEKKVRTVLRGPDPSNASFTEQWITNIPANAKIVAGTLSEGEFNALFQESDVVVIPYTPDAFAKRTSGLLIDALYFEIPVVVVEGTWMAGVVHSYGFGVVVEKSEAHLLKQGVLEVLAHLDAYRLKAKAASKRYFQANTWDALAAQILQPLLMEKIYPKIAVIDLTSLDGISATGRVKEAFFGGWPKSAFVVSSLDSRSGKMKLSGIRGEELMPPQEQDSIIDEIIKFSPDAVYYRAVDNEIVADFVETLVNKVPAPLVLHMMDDWPARLKSKDTSKFERFDMGLRKIISRSAQCLGISDAMNGVFQRRYGRRFHTFANAIDPASFPPRSRVYSENKMFVVRYTGAIADDMTQKSISEFAHAVELARSEVNIQFQIYTRQPWLSVAQKQFSGWKSIRVLNQVADDEYHDLIQSADALLIAYNFDAESKAYIGLSMANKMPEYLASGTPIIAYGPSGIATIDYLKKLSCALSITDPDTALIKSALVALVHSDMQRNKMGVLARGIAFDVHNVWKVAEQFRQVIRTVAQPNYSNSCEMQKVVLLGPMAREDCAHWDETMGISEIFCGPMTGAAMIDVGAHHGSALMPFLNKGWRIYAFEPDNKNRGKLLERLAKHKNKDLVSLDTRCISDKPQKGVAFFTSEQSTGISGLSAFHESHIEAQQVDITTLTEFFANKPLPEVDFLKIDTEGHDLFVLQGFPWERGKPAVIECEFEDTKTVPLGYTFHDLARFLLDKGYTVYVSEWHPIIRYGIRHDWNQLLRYPCELADTKGWGNLLAFRDPIDEQALVAAVKKVLKVGAGETAQKPAMPPIPASAPLLPAVTMPMSGALRGFRVEQSPYFAPIKPYQWRYTHSDAKQKLWVAAMEAPGPTAARSFIGQLQMLSDRAMTVNVSFGRHGKTEYEGVSQRITLVPGVAQSVKLSTRFEQMHAALELQLEVTELPGGGTAVLTIDGLGVNESLASIRDRLGAENLNLATANRLFRESDFPTALGIYLWLSQQRPLPMYGDNAVRAARRAGMPWVKAARDVAWVVG